MFERLFPRCIDNGYEGSKAALWLLGALLFVNLTMSLNCIFNANDVTAAADGIPMTTFPEAASRVIIQDTAIWGIAHLTIALLGVLVLVRYRRAVPLLFAMHLFEHLGQRAIHKALPIVHVGAAPGPYINIGLLSIMLIGLALSLLRRGALPMRTSSAPAS